ncbi:MAG: nucleotidyl transferase AbiEii/AbiGii toxin family protein [Alphaproteobacteria bacterium]|nr:nucleotidyl transferase AbiEii/AbiGii toxin family protein [Alphaproteobacteria bacterium]
MADKPSDIAASVRQRLLNLAQKDGSDFQLLLIRYVLERLLYRLSQSPVRDEFVLKGAMLQAIWLENPFRHTRDLDLHARGARTPVVCWPLSALSWELKYTTTASYSTAPPFRPNPSARMSPMAASG